MSQNAKLIKAMQDGRTVTRLTAFHMQIMNLPARIAEIRNAGHDVICTMQSDTSGNQYGQYTLA